MKSEKVNTATPNPTNEAHKGPGRQEKYFPQLTQLKKFVEMSFSLLVGANFLLF